MNLESLSIHLQVCNIWAVMRIAAAESVGIMITFLIRTRQPSVQKTAATHSFPESRLVSDLKWHMCDVHIKSTQRYKMIKSLSYTHLMY